MKFFRFIKLNNKETTMNKQAAPNQPKPTTVLPDNMTWAWSEELKQWIAINKDDTYAVTDKNVANNVGYTPATSTTEAVNYTTASMEHILANLIDKKEIQRAEIENDYFNPLLANQFIALSGIDFNGNSRYRITKAGLKFLKIASENRLKRALEE